MTFGTMQKAIKVLDHGYVRYVDHLGSDEAIVRAARTSMGRGFVSWDPYRRCKLCDTVNRYGDAAIMFCVNADGLTKTPHEWVDHPKGDGGLLDFMMRLGHTSPFEMCELVIDVKIPMDAWRQWVRHRMASINEYSTRYAEAIDDMAETAPGEWRTQSKTNRQGSGGFLDAEVGAKLSRAERELHARARLVYADRLEAGVAKEQTRKDLPLSNYTALTWKCDLHNIFHFLSKRLDLAAQLEIRLYAQAVAAIVKEIWPRSYALFEEYKLYGVQLSRTEAAQLREVLAYYTDAGGEPFHGPAWAAGGGLAALLKKLGAA